MLGTNFKDYAVIFTQLEFGDEAFNTVELYSKWGQARLLRVPGAPDTGILCPQPPVGNLQGQAPATLMFAMVWGKKRARGHSHALHTLTVSQRLLLHAQVRQRWLAMKP